MTTYPATNLQLTYDSATNQWNFTEVAYDYGATPPPSWSGYTGEDPAYEYATENGDGNGDTDQDSCPPGYIYDETLKQCVIDPNYIAPAYAGEPEEGDYEKRIREDSGSPLTIWIPPVQNPDGTWIDGYNRQMPNTMAQFTSQDLFDWGLDKKYIDEQGNIIGPMQTTAEGILGALGQAGNQRAFNNWLRFYQREGGVKDISGMAGKVIPGRVSIPLSDIPGIAPAGYMHDRWVQYIKTIDLPGTTPQDVGALSADIFRPTITTPQDVGAPPVDIFKPAELEQDRKQELHEEELKQQIEKTVQEKVKTQEVKDEYRDKGIVTYKPRETGGYVTTPNVPSAPPGERGGGGYTKPEPKRRFSPAGGPRPEDRI